MKVTGFTNHDYTIGWIAALQIELAAAKGMLEAQHPSLPQEAGDTNNYTLGRLGPHNVVIACLPSIGNNAAAFAAANILRSFPNVRVGLMVGIGGGVPDHEGDDIRLGDVVVSSPEGTHGGVMQFDFGTAVQKDDMQDFVLKGYLNRPPSSLLSALRTLQANAEMKGYTFNQYHEEMLQKFPAMASTYGRPATDKLYHADYLHQGTKADCSGCSNAHLLQRTARTTSDVHYGLIGSSNEVIRDARTRNKWHSEKGIICFEMEAAGLMNDFPCLIIRGICDYSDTHKNKHWQRFASAQAAAFAKELLMNISPTQIETTPPPSWIVEAFDKQLNEHHVTQAAIKEIRDKLDDTTEHDLQCLAKVKATDPRMDKERIETTKGGLLKDSYIWILQAEEFKTWQEDRDKKLLWIRGDPGKGKTMLLCGIISELHKDHRFLSYFFCQASQNQLNSAVFVLRGIIFLLADQQPALIKHIRKHTDRSAGSVFEDYNAWFTLTAILKDCLDDSLTSNSVILIDALDECAEGRQNLVSLIVSCSEKYSARWIISSRNWPEIEKDLKVANKKTTLSLELNASSISVAVRSYISYRVDRLTVRQDYDQATRSEVAQYLNQHARDTFLWVALVCAHLEEVSSWETTATLQMFPPGLDDLYRRMLQKIVSSRNSSILVQLLALSTVVYRPLEIGEMMILLDADTALLRSPHFVKELIGLCGSFLTIKDLRIELIHQSAKDFLLAEGATSIFVHGQELIHEQIYTKSLEKLHSVLKRDIYQLKDPGVAIFDVSPPVPDPLGDVKYSCTYWIDHLLVQDDLNLEEQKSVKNRSLLRKFIEEQFIYWLEASSLLGAISTVSSSIHKLRKRIPTRPPRQHRHPDFVYMSELIQDASQFVRYFREPLELYPLQVYVAGLLFSPHCSVLKHIFTHEMPRWVEMKRGLSKTWPAGITLSHVVIGPDGLQFSPDHNQIAAVIDVGYPVIRGWDIDTGKQTFNIPGSEFSALRFSFLSNGNIASSEGRYCSIQLWNLPNGELQKTIHLDIPEGIKRDSTKPPRSPEEESMSHGDKNDNPEDTEAIFSRDAVLFARHSISNSLQVYETLSGLLKFCVEHDWHWSQALAFSNNKVYIVSCNIDTIGIWNIQTGCMVWTLSRRASCIRKAIFAPSGDFVAIVDNDLQLWDWSQNCQVYSINEVLHKCPSKDRKRVAIFKFSSRQLIVSSPTALLGVDLSDEAPIKLTRRFRDDIKSVAYSSDSATMAVGDSTAIYVWRVWDISRSDSLPRVLFSPEFVDLYICGDTVASFGKDATTQLHMTSLAGSNTHTSHTSILYTNITAQHGAISSDRHFVALAADNGTIETWNLADHKRLAIFKACVDNEYIRGIAWESQNKLVTIITTNRDFLTYWDALTGTKVGHLMLPDLPEDYGFDLHWSPENTFVIVSSWISIDIWNANTNIWQQLARGDNAGAAFRNMAFSPDETLFAYIDWQDGLRVWNVRTMELILIDHSANVSCSLVMGKGWLRTDESWYLIPADLKPVGYPERYDAYHVNISPDSWSTSLKEWIRFGTKNMIRIPGEYLPQSPIGSHRYWDIDGDRVAIGLTYDTLVLDVSWDKWVAQNNNGPSPSAVEKLKSKDTTNASFTLRSKSMKSA